MRRGANVVALIAGAAIAAGALGGCQGDADGPAPSPSESVASSAPPPSPSESTSPSPQAETAEEFIRRWVEVHTEMQNTGDTAEFRKLSRGCEPCIGLADQVDDIYAAGGFVETDGWTPTAFERVSRRGNTVIYLVSIDNAATEYRESADGETLTLPSGAGVERFELEKRGLSFVVRQISEQST